MPDAISLTPTPEETLEQQASASAKPVTNHKPRNTPAVGYDGTRQAPASPPVLSEETKKRLREQARQQRESIRACERVPFESLFPPFSIRPDEDAPEKDRDIYASYTAHFKSGTGGGHHTNRAPHADHLNGG